MLNSDGELDIIKKFNGAKCTGTYIRAYHPTNENCATLITKKISELRKIIRDVMHHPENTNNRKYTYQELQQSVEDMRAYIISKTI